MDGASIFYCGALNFFDTIFFVQVLLPPPPPPPPDAFPDEEFINLLGELDVSLPILRLDGPLSKLAEHADSVSDVLCYGTSLPFGAGTVLSLNAGLFRQLGRLGRADGAAIQLTINTALILEIFSGLNAKKGFSDSNTAYWTARAGKLHLFMLKKVCALLFVVGVPCTYGLR